MHKVSEMRQELEARTLNSKGLKSQLVARLSKALKTEQEQEEAGARAAEQAAAEKAQSADESNADTVAEESLDKKVRSRGLSNVFRLICKIAGGGREEEKR
jgi:hypothetical protein